MPQVHEWITTESPSGEPLRLDYDDNGHLYVNGKQIITKQDIKLEWWINVAVVLGALGAFAQGLAAVYALYK